MGLLCLQTALTVVRINYFFYHTRKQTQVGQKLEISLANMQLETGVAEQVFFTPYYTFSHLVTTSMVKCLWGETNPYGMYILGHKSVSWIPKPQGKNDFALMELTVRTFTKEDSIKINRCRLYLRVIMAYDLFSIDGSRLHPEITGHHPVQARISHIKWNHTETPPRSFWKIWDRFVAQVVHHLQQSGIHNNNLKDSHYSLKYSYCTHYGTLHSWDGTEYHTYLPKNRQPGPRNTIFPYASRISNREVNSDSLVPVDVKTQPTTLIILGRNPRYNPDLPKTEQSLWRQLDREARRLCGKIIMPNDHRRKIIDYIKSAKKSLIGVSDALVLHGHGRHAWILTTGERHHIGDPTMLIMGKGVVGGHQYNMSSARAELQGQTALAIMCSYLLKLHAEMDIPVTFLCNNQGILHGRQNHTQTKLRYHRRANMDLYLEYWMASNGLKIKNKWVKGHQDHGIKWFSMEDLAQLNLSADAMLNILCDKTASAAQQEGSPNPTLSW